MKAPVAAEPVTTGLGICRRTDAGGAPAAVDEAATAGACGSGAATGAGAEAGAEAEGADLAATGTTRWVRGSPGVGEDESAEATFGAATGGVAMTAGSLLSFSDAGDLLGA